MADIELVIKIDEEVYKKAKETHDVMCDSVWLGIKNGTPLPKGHGRLIDADLLEKEIEDYSEGAFAMTPEFLVKDAPTIIEADKAESEE